MVPEALPGHMHKEQGLGQQEFSLTTILVLCTGCFWAGTDTHALVSGVRPELIIQARPHHCQP